MHVYAVQNFDGQSLAVFGTLTEAHANVKIRAGRENLFIALFDIPTDKVSLLSLVDFAMNTDQVYALPGSALRTWAVTARGGIKEVTENE